MKDEDQTSFGPGAGKSLHARPIMMVDVRLAQGHPTDPDGIATTEKSIRITQTQLETAGFIDDDYDIDLFPVCEAFFHEHGADDALDEMLANVGGRMSDLLAKVGVSIENGAVVGVDAQAFVAGEAIGRRSFGEDSVILPHDDQYQGEYAHALMRLAMLHLGKDHPLTPMTDDEADRLMARILA